MSTLEKIAKGFVEFKKGMQITDKEKDHEQLETRGYIFNKPKKIRK
jgi:hypothetical protein